MCIHNNYNNYFNHLFKKLGIFSAEHFWSGLNSSRVMWTEEGNTVKFQKCSVEKVCKFLNMWLK